MAHSKADIVESRLALAKAIHQEIGIHTDYIQALKNALSAMKMVAAVEQAVPINEEDIPVAKGFFKGLAAQVTAGGNGQ